MTDYGIYDERATKCDHAERRDLANCSVCPRCSTLVMDGTVEAIYQDLTNELINVHDFDSANVYYEKILEDSLASVKKLLNL